jgi:hypothetical protein
MRLRPVTLALGLTLLTVCAVRGQSLTKMPSASPHSISTNLASVGVDGGPPQPPPPPKNLASFDVQNITATPSGLKIVIIGSNIGLLDFRIDRQDPNVQNPIPIVSDLSVTQIPDELRHVQEATGTVILPILLDAKTSKRYFLTTFAKSEDITEMDWGTVKNAKAFDGYDAPTAPTPPVFKLSFAPDAVTVSVSTDKPSNLTAEWHAEGKVVDTASVKNSQDPSVPLSFGKLNPPTAGQPQTLPAIALTLEDPNSHVTQQASIQLSVASNQAVTAKVKQQASANPSNQAKLSFSWSDLAKTGIGALLKFFMAGV